MGLNMLYSCPVRTPRRGRLIFGNSHMCGSAPCLPGYCLTPDTNVSKKSNLEQTRPRSAGIVPSTLTLTTNNNSNSNSNNENSTWGYQN